MTNEITDLKERKDRARTAFTELKSLLTSPEKVPPGSKPLRKLMLRGVCIDSSTTFVLRPKKATKESQGDGETGSANDWQWWSLKFEPPSSSWNNDEQAGSYEVKRVGEEEVLRAARYQGQGPLLLVYTASKADEIESLPLPESLHVSLFYKPICDLL